MDLLLILSGRPRDMRRICKGSKGRQGFHERLLELQSGMALDTYISV